MWSKGSEETRNNKGRSNMFWMWEEGAQEVGVPTEERRKEGGSGTTTRSIGKDKGALWGKRTAA